MIVYHLVFDLYFLNLTSLDPLAFPLIIFARLIASLFLFLVGVTFFLSQKKYPHHRQLFIHSLKHSLVIFLAASLVSLVTFLINPGLTVRFGILHLISVSLLLLLPLSLIKSSLPLLLLATLFLIIPQSSSVSPSFDYYPAFPWFGAVLLGYALASKIPLSHPEKPPPPLFSPLLFLGRHSLTTYLFHQPILIFFLYLLSRFSNV